MLNLFEPLLKLIKLNKLNTDSIYFKLHYKLSLVQIDILGNYHIVANYRSLFHCWLHVAHYWLPGKSFLSQSSAPQDREDNHKN